MDVHLYKILYIVLSDVVIAGNIISIIILLVLIFVMILL